MRRFALAAFLTVLALGPVAADGAMQVTGAYATVSRPNAPSGAVYMTIENPDDTADRLLSASASLAQKTMLHTSQMSSDGLMQMQELPEGLVIPPKGTAAFAPGADHIMMLGLTRPLVEGDRFTLDLTFETAGKVVVIVTVGNAAVPDAVDHHSGHGMTPTP